MKTIATIVISAALAACASQSGAPAPASGASLKDTTQGTLATSAPAGTSPTAAPPAAEVVNQSYLKRGFKAVHRNGQLLYCQSQPVTGSLFQNTVCLTDAQMKTVDERNRAQVNEIDRQRDNATCTGVKCN